MSSFAALLEQFSVPELTRVMRRTALCAVALGVAALVVAVLVHHAAFGGGLALGLGLGLANIRLVTLQTAKVSESKPRRPIRALASFTLARLAVTTAIVVAIALVSTAIGIGAVGGIALFYLVFIANLLLGLLRPKKVAA